MAYWKMVFLAQNIACKETSEFILCGKDLDCCHMLPFIYTYCNGKQQRLVVCNLGSLWCQTCRCTSVYELKGPTTRAFSCFREKETDSVVRMSLEGSRSETTLYMPESAGARAASPTGSLLAETQRGSSEWLWSLLAAIQRASSG
jgi:hypothetical protein